MLQTKLLERSRFVAKVIHYVLKWWSSRHLEPHVKRTNRELIFDVKKSTSELPTA